MSMIITINNVRGGRFASNIRYGSGTRYPHHVRTLLGDLVKEMEEQLSAAMGNTPESTDDAPATRRDTGTVSSVQVVVPTPVSAPAHLVIENGKPRVVEADGEPVTPKTAIVDKGGRITPDDGGSVKVTRFGQPPGGDGMPALPSTGMFTTQGEPAFKTPGAPVSSVKAVVPPTLKKPAAPTPPADAAKPKSDGDTKSSSE